MPRKVERRKALVYSSISTSREVSNLTLRAALFFTWLLPSLDDQGRILVDSKLLKAVVVPMMDDITARRIPKLLAELEAQSLIHLYRPEGVNGEVIQVKSWWDFKRCASLKRVNTLRPRVGMIGSLEVNRVMEGPESLSNGTAP